jgi:hypothetical protein
VIFAVTMLLLVTGVVGVFQVHASPSPAGLLARARDFVHAHPSARFHGTTTVNAGDPLSPVADAHTDLAELSGEFTPGRTHAVISDDTGATELVKVQRAVYARVADSTDALAKATYVRADGQALRILRVRAEQAKSVDLVAVLDATSNAKKLSERGSATVIEGDVNATALFGRSLGKHVTSATLRVLVGGGGEVQGVRLVSHGEATITNRMQFGDWGSRDIAIAAPPAAQVDATPAIATVKLASFRATALLMPKSLPAGWELVRATVLGPGDTQEGCAQATLAYEDPRRAKGGYLYLYEFPRSCSHATPSDATPFTAGSYTGFSATQQSPYVQLTVGQTTVQAVSDLSLDDLAKTLSALVPLVLQSS